MGRPFTVTTAEVREWIETADRKRAAILDHINGGPLPEGRGFISGMEANDARNWAKYDMRQKIAQALMNLRPRDIVRNIDRLKWMDATIPAMVEELIGDFENDDILDLVAATGEIPAGVTL